MTVRSRDSQREADRGVVLVNVLAMLALAGAVVTIMLTAQERGVRQSQRQQDGVTARALAHGALTSAVIALRRDLEVAPEIDHSREPWADLAEQQVQIDGGQFSLSIRDAQGRFNINNLARGDRAAFRTFLEIARTARVPEATARSVALGLEQSGEITDLALLTRVGVEPDVLGALALYVTALPGKTYVNINAVSEALLAVVLQNPVRARVLIAQRDRQGYLTPEDVRRARVLLPGGLGYTSSHFTVVAEVTSGDARQHLTAEVVRSTKNGAKRVEPRRLKWNAAAP